MRAIQGVEVSSTMTKLNPRPRKYASASDRQAAYRARAPEMCLRAESKTVDTLDKIAADLDISRADLLLSMTKFALANHDWARFGLTHKPLPFEYGIEKENIAMNPLPIWARPRPKNLGKSIPLTAVQKRKAKSLAAAAGRKYPNLVDNIAALRNPTMKKPSPAQIAARKKFAEMARSGALNRKRQIMRNPVVPSADYDYAMINEIKLVAVNDANLYRQQGRPIIENLAKKLAKNQFDATKAVKLYQYLADSAVKKYSTEQLDKKTPTLTILSKPERQILAQNLFEYYADEIKDASEDYLPKRKTNPAKKTVSQKISQLVHEGYPQKQSIAIALSEQRKGKVKSNPMIISAQADKNLSKQGSRGYIRKLLDQYSDMGHLVSIKQARTGSIAIALDGGRYINVEAAKGKLEKFFGITDKTGQKTNPASGRKGSQTLLNPMAAPVKSNSYSNFKYCVEAKRSLGAAGSVFETVAMFATKAQAQDYAKAILKSHPSVTLRIKTYK
jgi:hypothetical protein